MSMSQEEIEALMNGLDIGDDEADTEEVPQKVNTDEIEQLLSQKDEIKEDIEVEEDKEIGDIDFDIDSILADSNEFSSKDLVDNSEIDDLLKDIEASNSEMSKVDVSIEETKDKKESTSEKKDVLPEEKIHLNEDDIVKSWTSSKINEGVIPLPAEKDTKVVNQLSQVANDSEEKVSQIFDVLSLTLDNNSALRNQIKSLEQFIDSQANLLNSLNSRFPNINIFNQNLDKIKNVSTELNSLKSSLNDEDNHIFQAMELMQFNDINRQKIERVMSVIRKLSIYLNNLFEDDSSHNEIAVAKHIHGDTSDDLIGDDLDKLIAEFNKDK